MALYLLHQSALGYALFLIPGLDEIGQNTEAIRNCIFDLNQFTEVVELTAFHPFESVLDAFNQSYSIWEGIVTDELRSFLESQLPKVEGSRKSKFTLGIAGPKIGSKIYETTKILCQYNEFVLELLCGVRMHFDKYIKDCKPVDLDEAQLGLENLIIRDILVLDNLDKDINSFSKKVRKCYSCHFPELVKIVNDNYLYAQVAKLVKDKSKLSEDNILALTEILGDEDKAKRVVESGKASMGKDLSPVDSSNVQQFSQWVIKLSDDRKKQYDYLVTKMNEIAPTLVSLVGEVVGARMISHAGSLRNLATWPSNTVQTALTRALKTEGSKIFLSTASRSANKCSLACRVDYFADKSAPNSGELHKQFTRLDLNDKAAMKENKRKRKKTKQEKQI